MVSVSLGSSWLTTPSWPHEMQSSSFRQWIFGFGPDIYLCPELPKDLLRSGLSSCIHSLSLVMIRCKKKKKNKTNSSFLAVEAAVDMWQDAVRFLSVSTRTASNILVFELFRILSNFSQLLCDKLLMFFFFFCKFSSGLARILMKYILSFFVFKCFRCSRAFFFNFNIWIIIFKASKPISPLCFRQCMIAISLNKNSVCFSCRLLFNK